MTEAILLFNDSGIATEMLYPEFEAVLDNVVSMPEWADHQVRAAYVVINPRLQVRSVVLFYLDFDEQGTADSGWNIPLRQLVEKAEYGPDLEGGPIRLVCRSQSPVPWLQMHLWDPDFNSAHNQLHLIRDAIQRNQLRLVVEEEEPIPATRFALDRLQVAAEEDWQLPSELERKKQQEREAAEREREQRQKAAQLIKQQRLRIRTLETEYSEVISGLRQRAAQRSAADQQTIEQLQQQLQAGQDESLQLQNRLQRLGKIGEETRQRLSQLEGQGESQLAALREQFEREFQTHRELLAADYQEKQQQSQREHEVQIAGLKAELEQERKNTKAVRQESKEMLQASQSVLQQLHEADVSLVTLQPGAGYITIPVSEVDEYLRSPVSYAAKYCQVSVEDYQVWLKHYEKPVCDAIVPLTGEQCGLPLERKIHPGRFTPGISNRCSRHRELW